MCSAEHTPEVYIIPVTIPSPLALILIFQLLEHSSPTVAGVLVPTLFLHQMTAPSQGAHLPPPGKCACVFVCVCRWVAGEQISSVPSGREAIDPSIATRREVLFTTHTEIFRENSPQCHTMVVKFSRMETS